MTRLARVWRRLRGADPVVAAFAMSVPLLTRCRLPGVLDRLEAMQAPRAEPGRARALDIVDEVDRTLVAVRRLVPATCMVRGLTLWFFLRRAGADAAVVFGIGEVEGRVEGHCWVEWQGEPLAEQQDPRRDFAEMWRHQGGGQGSVLAGTPAAR